MDANNRKQAWTIWYVVVAVTGVLLAQQAWNAFEQTETISYSEFQTLVADKKISRSLSAPTLSKGRSKRRRRMA